MGGAVAKFDFATAPFFFCSLCGEKPLFRIFGAGNKTGVLCLCRRGSIGIGLSSVVARTRVRCLTNREMLSLG